MVVKFTFQSVFGNSPQSLSHFSGRGREESLNCILSFDRIGQRQNKRFYVTEIVLPLGFADAIFGGREATTGNVSALRRLDQHVLPCPFGRIQYSITTSFQIGFTMPYNGIVLFMNVKQIYCGNGPKNYLLYLKT